MHKKFKINRTKIKGGCQLGGKVVTHNSKNDLPLSNALRGLRASFFSNACKKCSVGGTLFALGSLCVPH